MSNSKMIEMLICHGEDPVFILSLKGSEIEAVFNRVFGEGREE
jgi:hypothetical protein